MKIRVADIGPDGVDLDETLGIDWLEEVLEGDFPTPFEPIGPMTISGRVQRLGLDVVVELVCSPQLSTSCASCLKPFELQVPVSFHMTLKPESRPGDPLPAEQELTEQELDEAYYLGDTLELGGLLREQIILSLPMFPRCSESCRGLCPKCGADRNELECNCEREEGDPRWAALKEFKAH